MLQNDYRISLDRILALSAMLLIYIYHFVYWQYWYWVDEHIFTNYITLLKAAEFVSVADPLEWILSSTWYSALLYLFPLLLTLSGRWPRVAFYLIFVSGYFIPIAPYQSVIVVGTVDEGLFMLSVAAVGLLFARDVEKSKLFSNGFDKVIRSTVFKGITALLALAVVCVSVFVNTEQAVEVANTAATMGDKSLAKVQIGLPFIQAIIFLFCAAGVFITTSRAQVTFLTMSWLVIFAPWQIQSQYRLEPASFTLLLELYTYLSAMVIWRALAPKSATHQKSAFGDHAAH